MKANGGETLVDSMKRLGIDCSFGIVGSSLLEVFDLLPEAGIEYIGARHEQWAGHMADGYARASGKISALLAQNGAGLTNVVTASSTAKKANSPILIVSGSPLSKTIGRGTYQEEDHVAVMQPVTKWSRRVERADRISENVKTARNIAMTTPRGPTHIDVPRDFLYEIVDYEGLNTDFYIDNFESILSVEVLKQIEELLKGSDKTVLIAGGACNNENISKRLIEFSKRLSIPICSTYGHNDVVQSDYPLMLGSIGRGGSEAAMNAVKEADLLLCIGTRLDEFTFLPYYGFSYFPKEAKIVQFTANPEHLGRSYQITLGVLCNAVSAVRALVDVANNISINDGTKNERFQKFSNEKRIWEEKITKREQNSNDHEIEIKDVYLYLRENIPHDAIVTVDIGSSPSFSYSLLKFYYNRTFMPPGPLGGVGFSIPAAIGAGIARNGEPPYALLGDGAFTMELSALMTAVEYKIPLNVVVFDNSAWGAEKANQQYFYDSRFIGTNLNNPDLVTVSKSLGAYSKMVEDYNELDKTMKDVFSNKGVNVVVVKVDPLKLPLPARRDALQKPFRGIYK